MGRSVSQVGDKDVCEGKSVAVSDLSVAGEGEHSGRAAPAVIPETGPSYGVGDGCAATAKQARSSR